MRLFFIVVWLWAAAGAALAQGRVIEVTGTGEVAAAPDMATLRMGVSAEARAAADALAQMSDGLAAVLARLEAAGIAAADVQTGTLDLRPRFDNSGARATRIGFTASSTLVVRVRDLSSLGALLDAAVADGTTELNQLQFGLSDPSAAQAEARAAAVRDAAAKAGQIAAAAGVTLGAPMQIREGGGGGPQPMGMEMARAAAVPIAEGEVAIRVMVTATYAIE